MDSQDAILEFLAKEPLSKLNLLAKDRKAAARRLSDYLPDEQSEEGIASDSQESQEAATMDAQYLAYATLTWKELSQAARDGLMETFVVLVGKWQADQLLERLSTIPTS